MVKFCVKILVQPLLLKKVQGNQMRKTLPTVVLSASEESKPSNQNTGFFASAQNEENSSCHMQLFKKGFNRV